MTKNREQLLELAWRAAFDSATSKASGNSSHKYEMITEATEQIRMIDKEDWNPIVRQILRSNNYVDDHRLAEDAATIFINRKMDTTGIKVSFEGDW
ncbi:MAG: hypothetical protein KUL85_10130 [Sphingobacterium mizutaii]|nr:hypothetical protein [Sphingobacterium mizutaii]